MSAPIPGATFAPDELAAFVADLLTETALRDVLQARLDQVLVHGHTAEKDAGLPIAYFTRELADRARSIAEGQQFNQPRAIQRRRTIKLAALALALLQRLDLEAQKEAQHG